MIANPMEYKNKLLSEFYSKKISMKELEIECAMWFLNTFDTIHKKPYPSMPMEYQDYKNLPFERRQKIAGEFFQQPVIKNYLDIKEKIKNENDTILYHLHEHLKTIPEGDFVSRAKFNEKIVEFQSGLDHENSS